MRQALLPLQHDCWAQPQVQPVAQDQPQPQQQQLQLAAADGSRGGGEGAGGSQPEQQAPVCDAEEPQRQHEQQGGQAEGAPEPEASSPAAAKAAPQASSGGTPDAKAVAADAPDGSPIWGLHHEPGEQQQQQQQSPPRRPSVPALQLDQHLRDPPSPVAWGAPSGAGAVPAPAATLDTPRGRSGAPLLTPRSTGPARSRSPLLTPRCSAPASPGFRG
ncbi:MAG: hypothetical protein J3K34DRAFT_434487 [Monoraphidium minutum]|nr:MAG: hypothetical protein J3K34DRAFT_434487 [Monoraphidium minutum]